MKYWKLLIALFALLLCACADAGGTCEDPSQEQTEPAVPIYAIEDAVREKEFYTEAGELYASYSYHFPMMQVLNLEELDPAVRETASRNVEAFNALMQQELEDAVTFGEEMGEDDTYNGYMPMSDEKELSVTRQGEILTVLANCYFYGGGAHPYVYTITFTFDLTLGQFLDPAQIGDDPELFRQKAAELLVVKAEALGEDYVEGYWADYAEIIAHWNETAVIFETGGMKVIFSPYELGPYAMGSVELFLTYEELADAIGPGGLQQLGVR